MPELPPLSKRLEVPPDAVVGYLLRREPFVSQRRRISILKHCLEPLEDAHVKPLWRRRLILIAVHCLEQVIKDNVEHRTEVASAKVSDQSNILSMQGRHSKALGTTRAWVPLGDLPSSLCELGLWDATW